MQLLRKNTYMDIGKIQIATEFYYNFKNEFLLLSKREVIENNIFGVGKMHPKFEEFIGDFLAIAISDKGIVYSQDSNQFISNHAGITEKEMKIPVIAICKNKRYI